jgi:hypothetical protein
VPFDLGYRRHMPLVPRSLRLEMSGVDASGNIIGPLQLDVGERLCRRADAPALV